MRVLICIAALVSGFLALNAGNYDFPEISPYLGNNVRMMDADNFAKECGHLQADFESYIHGLIEENKRANLGVRPLDNFIPEERIVRGNLYIPWDDGQRLGLVGIGTFSYLGAVPVVVGVLDAQLNQIRYLDNIPFAVWRANSVMTVGEDHQVLFLENRNTMIETLFRPMELQYKELILSSEAQSALFRLRQIYYTHGQKGDDSISLEDALQEAKIEASVLENWQFTALGQPPDIYIATSTQKMPLGSDKQVWLDEKDKKYHGFGVDKETLDGN